ncbi:MAG: orotate phosphoribosyltransferase [Nitrospira sp. UW-LDO-01]|nr:MAG: orotate phosphoribosyltransferase [Nitrospira sp. UW-LDO-01]
MTLREQLAKAFHDSGSFKWDRTNGFKLASGEISPFYVDCRALMAHPEARRLVAQLAYDTLVQVEFDCLGGLEIGAIPIAVTISDFACAASPSKIWRTFVVRKQAKDHGLGKLIEGSIHPGDRVLIVDDVLTSGGSLLKAVGAAREAGLQVDHALVIVDRQEQDGKARVEKERVQLRSLLTIQDLMHVMKKSS